MNSNAAVSMLTLSYHEIKVQENPDAVFLQCLVLERQDGVFLISVLRSHSRTRYVTITDCLCIVRTIAYDSNECLQTTA